VRDDSIVVDQNVTVFFDRFRVADVIDPNRRFGSIGASHKPPERFGKQVVASNY
jgi:hypothetical protein